MDYEPLHRVLRAYLAGELALEPAARALARACRESSEGLAVLIDPLGPAEREREAALWTRASVLLIPDPPGE